MDKSVGVNIDILPLEHEELYPLHRDTRPINTLE